MDRHAPSPWGLRAQLARGGAAALVRALDHLLAQNDWARQRLAMHAGRILLIGIDAPAVPGLPEPRMLARIAEGGRLQRAGPEDAQAAPAVTMLLRPSVDAAFDFFRGGAPALARHLHIEGDVMLAGALGEIARHLRWDATEDLSRFTGDVAAQRLVGMVAGAADALRDAGRRIESSAARFLSVESGQLADREALEAFALELDLLEQRISTLAAAMSGERSAAPGPAPRPHAFAAPAPAAAPQVHARSDPAAPPPASAVPGPAVESPLTSFPGTDAADQTGRPPSGQAPG